METSTGITVVVVMIVGFTTSLISAYHH